MICVRLLFQQQDSILIARRADTEFAPGLWSFIGGVVQPNETATDAVVRKAREEVGVVVNKNALRLVHTMHRKSDDKTIIILFFKIIEWEGFPAHKACHKYERVMWCNLQDLPSHCMPAHQQALKLILQEIPYSEHGW